MHHSDLYVLLFYQHKKSSMIYRIGQVHHLKIYTELYKFAFYLLHVVSKMYNEKMTNH